MHHVKHSIKKPFMICTQAKGGMRAVVEGYVENKLIDKWNFEILWTHKDGSLLLRLKIAVISFFYFFKQLLYRKVSFVHVHTAMYGSFWRKSLFSQAARIFNVPVIMHLHGSEMESFYNSLPFFSRKLVKYSLEKAKYVVVLSFSWQSFIKRIAPQANTVVVSNYVSPPIAASFNATTSKFEVLFLGLIGHRKGIYDLLQAWKVISKQIPYAKLRIGGNGEIEKARQFAVDLGIEGSTEFLGWVTGVDKEKLLQSADVFILPSYNEGLPMSVLEAMSWQKAVITTKVGGIPELIKHNHDGLLFEPGNIEDLTSAILALANDLELREKLSLNARGKILRQYSPSSNLPILESIYQAVS